MPMYSIYNNNTHQFPQLITTMAMPQQQYNYNHMRPHNSNNNTGLGLGLGHGHTHGHGHSFLEVANGSRYDNHHHHHAVSAVNGKQQNLKSNSTNNYMDKKI